MAVRLLGGAAEEPLSNEQPLSSRTVIEMMNRVRHFFTVKFLERIEQFDVEEYSKAIQLGMELPPTLIASHNDKCSRQGS